jgi:hypothetical protein
VSQTGRARLNPVIALNLGVRFLLEIWLLCALAWAGAEVGAGHSWLVSLALAIAFAVPAALVWGLFVAPKAPRRLDDPTRLVVELLLFASAADALAYVGNVALAVVFAVLVITNTAVLRLSRTEH